MAARLSLCMILRDEEEMLPGFLERARGLWDELVAVDTGSADRTPAILRAAGARVLHEPWRADFAAARNVSLAAATGDWVLVLDADEWVGPELAAAARALLDDDLAGAATVRVVDRLPHGHRRESRLLRMFRRDPAVRFRHAIHEDASEGVLASLERTGRRLVHLEGSVEHLGYVRARAAARDKRARDVAILERCLAVDPLDLYSHLKRLEQARFWGDRALWGRAAAEAAAAIEKAPERLAALAQGGELLALVADGLHPGDPGRALAWLEARAGRAPPSAAFHLRRGELREVAGRLADAAGDYARCRTLAGVTQDLQLATVRPLLGLARVDLARGDLAAAGARVDAALAIAPRDPEALLAAVAIRRSAGGAAAIAAFAAAHAAAHGDPAEVDEAVGEEALLAGDLATARPALERAAARPGGGGAGVRLAVARLAAGEVAGARSAAAAVAGEVPVAGLVGVLCDLVEGRDSAVDLELEREEADRALREMAAGLSASAGPAVRARLLAAAPALAEVFPWLPSALGALMPGAGAAGGAPGAPGR
jgi:hypothetical protein